MMENKTRQSKKIGIIVGVAVLLVCIAATVLRFASGGFKGHNALTTESTASSAASTESTSQALTESTTESTTETTTQPKERTGKTKDYLNVRDRASLDSNVIATLAPGDSVTVIGEEGEFFKIVYNDKERYVYADYVEITGVVEPTSESTSEKETESTSESTVESISESTSESTKQNVQSGTSSKGYEIKKENGITYVDGILIANKTYSLPQSFYPETLTDETQQAFDKMQAAAAKEGVELNIVSGFRSYETQQRIYENYVARDGKNAADTYSARAGHSEHQSGLAMDVNSLSSSFGETVEGKWLAQNCSDYGFIIRYPEGKESITGYMYEPWHIRYLGLDLAKKVKASGLCLEEYLGIGSSYSD